MTAAKKKPPSKSLVKRELTKRDKFCHEYVLNGQNGTQAYLAAGYKCTIRAAWVSAHRMLRDAKVITRIKELQEQYYALLTSKREDFIREIDNLAMFDPINMFGPTGQLLKLHEMDAVTRKSINEIEMIITEGGGITAKVKYGKDKRGYLDMMMKFFNLYEEHQKSTGTGTFEVRYMYPQDEHL